MKGCKVTCVNLQHVMCINLHQCRIYDPHAHTIHMALGLPCKCKGPAIATLICCNPPPATATTPATSTHTNCRTTNLQHAHLLPPPPKPHLHLPSQLPQWQCQHLPPPHGTAPMHHHAQLQHHTRRKGRTCAPPPPNCPAPTAARPCADPHRLSQLRRCNTSNAGTCNGAWVRGQRLHPMVVHLHVLSARSCW